jgi:hypothetical protein
MNDRARALAILKQAREILMQRLTDRVLDNEEEILNDARGESYMGEIDALYDQVGTPLVHLNQILSSLPVEEDVQVHETHTPQHSAAHSYAEIVPPAWPEVPALPAPRSSSGVETAEDTIAPISFQTFAAQIQAGDISGAGGSLAYLFDIPLLRAARCAEHFHIQLREDPDFLVKAMQLRRELASGGYNGAIMLLYQCFGLTGVEAIGVYQVLKVRLG